jgi:hypothetical protein
MAYRNGTYIAFHANGTSEPTESDIKYFNLIKAWHENEAIDFTLIDSHTKSSAVRDSSKRTTLENALKGRLRNSKNMLLIIGNTTREDKDWIPFEIEYAVDYCKIPIIIAYTGYDYICVPGELSYLWPSELSVRVENKSIKAIHIPFKKEPIQDAINRYNHEIQPPGSLTYYSYEAYRGWGIAK